MEIWSQAETLSRTNLKRIGPNVVLERFSYFADSIFGGLVEPGEESGRGAGDVVFASLSARFQIRFRD